jgi:hypothetical protein
MAPKSKSFRERLAWLGRMPTHYRILFGVQIMFTTVAVNWRLADVRRRRKIRDEEELSESVVESLRSNNNE